MTRARTRTTPHIYLQSLDWYLSIMILCLEFICLLSSIPLRFGLSTFLEPFHVVWYRLLIPAVYVSLDYVCLHDARPMNSKVVSESWALRLWRCWSFYRSQDTTDSVHVLYIFDLCVRCLQSVEESRKIRLYITKTKGEHTQSHKLILGTSGCCVLMIV